MRTRWLVKVAAKGGLRKTWLVEKLVCVEEGVWFIESQFVVGLCKSWQSGFLRKVLGVKECLCESWLLQKWVCVEAGVFVCVCVCVCQTLEIEQEGAKWVDASGRAVFVKAVSADEDQWQELVESVGCKSGRLARTYVCLEGAGRYGENVENAASQRREGLQHVE